MHKYLLSLFVGILFLTSFNTFAQEQREDGTWWDNNLKFELIFEEIRRGGELEFCIYDSKNERCIYNVMTGYEVNVYNAKNEKIWTSLWSGKTTEIKFKQKFKEASWFEIKAIRPFVVNKDTGTRIYQDKALYLKHKIVSPY